MRSIARSLAHALFNRGRGANALLVLGMHRSGTSFLTGSLQEAGLELGDHSAWNPFNTRGNRENPGFVEFHEQLLATRGCSWDTPPEGMVRWTAAERSAALALVTRYRNTPRWGFKDPRALLFAHNWRELLPRACFVGIFRHPVAVARSLSARGGMEAEAAIRLWSHYNQRLLELHRREPFPLLCFDDPEEHLHARLDVVLRRLGLEPPDGDRFWSAQLRHNDAYAEPLPDNTVDLYVELRSRVVEFAPRAPRA